MEGRLLRGSHHAAGELGSCVPEPHLLDRNWRPNGCLEQLAGGAALGEAWNPGGRPTTSRDVFAAAHASDADALALVRRAADYLAQAVIAVGCILDPDIVILGGSIALRQESVTRHLKRRLKESLASPPEVIPASLGTEAPLIGALALACGLTELP